MFAPILIVGNWKMHGRIADVAQIDAMARGIAQRPRADVMMAVAPPATLIAHARPSAGEVVLGAQNCHAAASGAHTGDLSAGMLKEVGARFVIVGHSERRADHGETDALVSHKATAARSEGLGVIVCVGESQRERDAGQAEEVCARQVRGSLPTGALDPDFVAVAYEPLWAIGSGRTPSADEIASAHAAVRDACQTVGLSGDAVRVLYGGSVKPANAAQILATPGVDGALVGGASLTADDLLAIRAAAPDRQPIQSSPPA